MKRTPTPSVLLATALFFCLFLLFGFAVQAQSMEDFKHSTPEQRAQAQTEYLKTNLQLDDEQTQKVADINLKYAQKMESVIKGGSGRLAKMKAAKNINGQKEAEYKQVFTSDQYKKYGELKEDMKDNAKKKMKQRKTQ
jgi:parvulin-like peptidyl-prolyl isomerase